MFTNYLKHTAVNPPAAPSYVGKTNLKVPLLPVEEVSITLYITRFIVAGSSQAAVVLGGSPWPVRTEVRKFPRV